MKLKISCPKCSSKDVWKLGFYKHKGKKYQRYRCKKCFYVFSERGMDEFARIRYDKEIVLLCLWLYSRFVVSTYDVEKIVKKFKGVRVPARTVLNWVHKFGKDRNFLKELKARDKEFKRIAKVWHLDEMYVKARGRMNYLYVCCDEKSRIVAMHVSDKRESKGVVRLLRKAVNNAGYKPEIVVSDGWHGYDNRTLRKGLGVRKIKHVISHFERKIVFHKGNLYSLSNNRIEGLISWLRNRYRKFRGFNNMEKFSSFLNLWEIGRMVE